VVHSFKGHPYGILCFFSKKWVVPCGSWNLRLRPEGLGVFPAISPGFSWRLATSCGSRWTGPWCSSD
jgi:hypothetical protein